MPQEYKEDFNNLGSRLTTGAASMEWDWESGKHKRGVLEIHDHLRHESSKQYMGIAPGKPGIYTTKPIKVVKGTFRRLA